MKVERRDHFAEVRATEIDGKPGVTLHAITPGIVDDYGSLWMADAFDESLAQRMPTLCWAHDWTEPLGPPVAFRTGPNGPDVDFTFSDFDAVHQARRAYAQVKDGTIEDCSVGFSNAQRRSPTDDEVDQYPGIREVIEKADLDEISLVLRGAVPGAKVLAVRSKDGTVSIDDVVELARRKAADEINIDEARAALDLLGGTRVDPDEDMGQLALAVDAALDSAIACASGIDITSWPAEAQQMFGNVVAAEAAIDDLLEAAGLTDPDDPDTSAMTGYGQLSAEEDETRAASGSADWPIGSRDAAWDGSAAEGRLRSWAGVDADDPSDAAWAKYASAHFWVDSSAKDNLGSYKLAFCDVNDGKVTAMPRGIFACAAVLNGSRGGVDVGGDEAAVKGRVAGYYARMAKQFNDDTIKPPWDQKSAVAETDIDRALALVTRNR